MRQSRIVKVPLPQKGVTKAKSGVNQITYVYYYTAIFRNGDGKPDNKRVSIGRYLESEDLMIPNDNYYKIFGTDKIQDEVNALNISEILRIGEFVLFDKIAGDIGIAEIIDNVFGDEANEVLTTTMFMLCNNKASMYLEDFHKENYTYSSRPINASSRLYKSIDFDKRFAFFKQWIGLNNADEYNAYDVTSISSYSNSSELTEYGYNRDGENLAQVNLGVFFGEKSRLPKYYNCYSGSITDKTYLPYIMQGTRELGIKISRFILDKGFISKHNIEYMIENELDFIICTNETIKVKEYVFRNIDDVKNPENYILAHSTYGKPVRYDENVNIHIFHDSEKAAGSEKDFYARIAMHENELQQLKVLDRKTARKYKTYFNITIKKDESFTYEKDYCKIKEAHKLIGYFACLVSEAGLSSEEVIEIYRRKDGVEKYFDNHKHFADGKRFRTHNDLTGQGKMFILFLSLIFKSYIDKTIGIHTKATLTEKKKTVYSVEKIMLELSRIKIITINGRTRLVQPITKKQRDILAWFKVSEKDVLDFVEKL